MLRTDNIYIVLYQFSNNPLRTLLSISGIMIGIATLLTMTILNEGMTNQMLKILEERGGANLIEIRPKTEVKYISDFEINEIIKYPISLEFVNKLNSNFAEEIIPIQTCAKRFKLTKKISQFPRVIGTSPEFIQASNNDLLKGRFISDYDVLKCNQVVVINENLAKEYFQNKNIIGKYLNIGELYMQIIGICNSEYDVYIPITTALKKVKGKNEIGKLVLYAKNFEEVDAVVDKLKISLRSMSGSDKYFLINVPSDRIKKMFEARESFSRLLTIITIICLVVGGIGVMNTMLSSVNERIREIGILKSVGAKNKEVLKQFISESLFICIIGGFIGILLGIFAGEAAAGMLVQERYLKNIEAVVSLKSILIAVGFTTLVGIAFGIYPAIKAAKINPVDALRYE